MIVLSQINPVHTLRHPISPRSVSVLSTHQRLGLPSGLQSAGSHINNLYAFLFALIHATCPTLFMFLNLIFIIILGEEYKL
jgi:hypothetical protein